MQKTTHSPSGVTRRTLLANAVGISAFAAAPRPLRAASTGALADVARGLEQLHSLVITQRGETILAEAFRGPALDRPANVKSVSKTLLATLVGIAIDKGIVAGPDAPVRPLLGLAPSPDAPVLTVGHLMSMRSGLASTSGRNYGAWVASGNWVDFALEQPQVAPPGTRFIYSTGNYHVLGAALTRATGRPLVDLARDWLGAPLDASFPAWVRDPQGNYLGGNEMAMSPLAMSRFAQMCLARGTWNGKRVVTPDWLATSWAPRATSPFSGDRYGYGWFLSRLAGEDVAYGRGYGGQMVLLAPDLGVTMAITSDPTRPARSGGYFGDLKALARLTLTTLRQA